MSNVEFFSKSVENACHPVEEIDSLPLRSSFLNDVFADRAFVNAFAPSSSMLLCIDYRLKYL